MYDPSEALLQLGLYDYVWGNPSLLQTYNSNVQSEKARQENLQYQNMWKQIEQNKLNAEKQKTEAKELKDAEVEMAKLNKELVNAKPSDAVIIRKQQRALIAKHPSLKGSNIDAIRANEKEQAHQQYKVNFISNLPTVFKKNTDIDNAITNVMNDPTLYPDEKEKIIEGLRSKKSTEQLAAESSQSSIASHSGKKTTEALEETDLQSKATTAIKDNSSPSSLDEKVLNAIRNLGYTWKGTWVKR
jgi:hypothetical protein